MHFDKFILMSSPFTRCLQTANGIALQLSELGLTEVVDNYVICEHLTTKDFPDCNPLD
jgi:hypothetical protein